MNRNHIREHLMVHARGAGSMNGAPGEHVGTVDHVEGDFIKLTRNDSHTGEHRWVPIHWVDHVDDKAVYLNRTADEFYQGAMTSSPVEGSTDQQGSGNQGVGSAAASGMIAGGTGTSADLTGDVRGTSSGSSMLSDPSRLPSMAGGTVSGVPSSLSGTSVSATGMSGTEALGSAGGSIMSDPEIGVTGAQSPMGDREASTNLRNPNEGGTTDAFTAAGTGNTTGDQELMSGAGAQSGPNDGRNMHTGAHGNVSTQGTGQHVGQGTRRVSDDE